MLFSRSQVRGGGRLYLYGDEDAQPDAKAEMGNKTFAIAFVPEESILHVGGV